MEEVPAAALGLGDIVVLRPGARVPADGTIVRRPWRARRVDDHRRIHAGRQGAPAARCSRRPSISTACLRYEIAQIARTEHGGADDRAGDRGAGRQGSIGTVQRLVRPALYGCGAGGLRSSPSAFSTGLAGTGRPRFIAPRRCWSPQAPAQSSSRCPPPSCRRCRRPRVAACCSRAARRWRPWPRSTLRLRQDRHVDDGPRRSDGDCALRAANETTFLSALAGVEATPNITLPMRFGARRRAAGLALHDVHDVRAIPSAGIIGQDADGPLWAGNRRMADDDGASLDQARLFAALSGRRRDRGLSGARSAHSRRGQRRRQTARNVSAGALAALRASGVSDHRA